MRSKFILVILFAAIQLTFVSCQKDTLADSSVSSKPVVPVVVKDTTGVVNPTTYKRTLNLGTGTGDLTIDGTTLAVQCNDLIKIKGGSYGTITIKNIRSADGCPITIKNDGIVQLNGDFHEMALTDLKNVIISGDGTVGLAKGFQFSNNKYRAIEMYGKIDNFTLQNILFSNIKDSDISFQYKTAYDGSEDSYSKGLKFLNITCDNTSALLNCSGSVAGGSISGLIKGIEIAYLDFENSADAGSIVYMGNVEDYDVHNNRVNNINTTNNTHNGIFALSGNGKFYNNYVSNHQGNAIRAWGHTVGTTPKSVLIYNNIVVNSRKYSGFEVQAFDASMTPGKTTFVNAIVFNNTCGNLNTSNDWQGNVVDVYSLKGGKCDVYNNLGYNFQTGSVIAGQESDLIPNAHDNLYYKTSSEAGLIDQTTFKLTSSSPAKNRGIATPFIITDYYATARNSSKPSIGAVE